MWVKYVSLLVEFEWVKCAMSEAQAVAATVTSQDKDTRYVDTSGCKDKEIGIQSLHSDCNGSPE